MFSIHALIIGPTETPYEKGFFYFFLTIPHDYPLRPPRVKLMTTDGGHVRFNPNLYSTGKVCLSILGTWPGPSWSPMHTLTSVLVSIQSLLCEKPYHNEPGYAQEREAGDVLQYNEFILHETLRAAVCGMVLNETGLTMPPMMMFTIQQKFLEYLPYYQNICETKMHLDKKTMKNPLGILDGYTNKKYMYSGIMTKLLQIKACLQPAMLA